MTDLEISKALALAIGWLESRVSDRTEKEILITEWPRIGTCIVFDYRDWNVIAPIAEKFDAFPIHDTDTTWFASLPGWYGKRADTPQKAIALAVIGSVK